jgi:hypothetical protein
MQFKNYGYIMSEKSILSDVINKIKDIEKGDYKSKLSDDDLLQYIWKPHIMTSACEVKKEMLENIEKCHPALRDIIKHEYNLCINEEGNCRTEDESILGLLELLRD